MAKTKEQPGEARPGVYRVQIEPYPAKMFQAFSPVDAESQYRSFFAIARPELKPTITKVEAEVSDAA